jgi:four helix bundle protein
MEYTKRRNPNRGYMKLNVWNDAVELFKLTSISLNQIPKLDIKLRSQILDAVQSISANIAEGYCRRSLKEYLQFLYVALGSSGEAMTRMIGIRETGQLFQEGFEKFDELHYATENKLLALVKSL